MHEPVNGVVDTYRLEKEYQDKIDSLREEITSLKNEHAKRIEELEKKVMNKVYNFVKFLEKFTKLTTHVKIEREAVFDNVQENIGIIYD